MKHLFTAAATSALMAGTAFAGNIEPAPAEPVIAPAPMPVQATPSWAGGYVGANLTWGQADVDLKGGVPPLLANLGHGKTLSEPDGFGGGLRVGYDWQFDQIVFGMGGEYNFGKIDGGWKHPSIMAGITGQPHDSLNVKIKNAASLFARIGYDAGDWLPYALAGYTWADSKVNYASGSPSINRSYSNSIDGPTFGLGVERRLAENWTAYGEWTYTDFGTVGTLANLPYDVKTNMHQFKLGANYQF